MKDLVVRPAEPADVKAISDLIEEIERYYGATAVQPLGERVAQVKEALFSSPPLAYALLAVVNVEIAGFAAYSYLWPAAGSTYSLYLKELYVRQSFRRAGVGSRLMSEVASVAAARPGCSRVEWTADRDSPSAQSFYCALGYQEFEGKVMYRIASRSS